MSDPRTPSLATDSEARTRQALLHMLEDLREEGEIIREARRQWLETVDSVRDPLMVHDAEGRIVRANRAYAERAGMTFQELIGRPYWQCFPRRSGPLTQCAARHPAAHRGPGGEEDFVAEDGRIFVSRGFGVGKGPPGAGSALHLFEDVTEKRRAEERLRLMAYLVESSPTVVFRWRAEPGWPVDYVSDNVSLWGYSSEELTSGQRTYASLVHPEDIERIRLEVADYTARRLERFTQEYRIFTASGELRWVDDRTIVERDSSGAVRYYQGVVIDITERRLAGESLRESERRLATLMSNLPGMAYRCANDRAWTMEFVSDGCRALTGYEPEDLRGSTKVAYGDLIVAEDRETQWRAVQSALAEHRPFQLTYRIRAADGSTHWVWEQGEGVYRADGMLEAIEGFIADVTERMRLADAAEARSRRAQVQAEALSLIVASPALAGGDVKAFAREVTEAAARCADVERCNAWLFNGDETELRCIDSYEATPDRHSAGMVLKEAQFANEFQALKHEPYVNADDPLTDPRTAGYVESYLKPLGITSMLDVVIQTGGRHLGLLCLEHVGRAHHWEEDEIAFARQVSDKIALAITNSERRQAEEKHRVLFESSGDAFITLAAPEWRFESVNPAAIAMFRVADAAQLTAMPPWALSPPFQPDGVPSEEKARAMIDIAMRTGNHAFDWVHRRLDGEEFQATVLLTRLELEGRMLLNATVRDVTEQKRAESELRSRTAFFEALVKTSPDGLLVVDANGRKLLQNQRMVDLWKIPAAFAENPDDADQLRYVTSQVADPKPFVDKVLYLYAHPDEESRDEIAIRDGSVFERYSAPVRRAEGGSYGRIWSFRDITERKRLQHKIEESEARYRSLMEHASDVVALIDAQGIVRYVSPSVRQLGGHEPEEILDKPFTAFMHPDDVSAAMQNLGALVTTPGATHAAEFRYRRKDGRWVVLASMAKNALDDPAVRGVVLNARDVTEHKNAEQALARQNRMLAMLSGINTLIVRVRELDQLFSEACHIAVDAGKLPLAWITLRDPKDGAMRIAASAGADRGYLALPRPLAPDGKRIGLSSQALNTGHAAVCNDIEREPQAVRYPAEALERGFRSIAALPFIIGGEARGVLVLVAAEPGFFDAAEMKLAEELANDIAFAIDHIEKEKKVEYLAYYDTLTGLPRGALFMEAIGRPLAQAAAEGRTSALVVADFERFRNINDTLGRAAGDAVLTQAAKRLSAAVGDSVRLARMHADVFAFLLIGVESADAAARLVQNIAAHGFDEPLHVAAQEVPLGLRFGVAMSPADGSEPEVLYRNAESALKRAKESGERLMLYSADMNARVAERLGLEARMRKALDERQFELYFQPKVDSRTGRLTGLEALLRWNDPQGGVVAPGSFVPLLEETGLILPVGAWALRRAVLQAREWAAAGLPQVRIAVNVSALQLRQKDFIDTVLAALEESADARALELEITESLIMKDIAGNIARLGVLREAGISVAIDDFGTGYSSLAYIAKLPIDTLKIDRSFVVAMPESPDDLSIVSTIITLAHQLTLKVVAEGVDSEEQAKLLRLLKCDQMQGYLFARPMPAAEVARLLGKQLEPLKPAKAVQ